LQAIANNVYGPCNAGCRLGVIVELAERIGSNETA